MGCSTGQQTYAAQRAIADFAALEALESAE